MLKSHPVGGSASNKSRLKFKATKIMKVPKTIRIINNRAADKTRTARILEYIKTLMDKAHHKAWDKSLNIK